MVRKMGEESVMRSNWVKRLSNEIPRWYNVRMGKLPDREMAKVYSVILGYADLIYIKDGVVNIVEFKVRDFRGAIGQLLSYAQEFYNTVEFAPYHALPIQLSIVANRHDVIVEELAHKNNIKYEVFQV